CGVTPTASTPGTVQVLKAIEHPGSPAGPAATTSSLDKPSGRPGQVQCLDSHEGSRPTPPRRQLPPARSRVLAVALKRDVSRHLPSRGLRMRSKVGRVLPSRNVTPFGENAMRSW